MSNKLKLKGKLRHHNTIYKSIDVAEKLIDDIPHNTVLRLDQQITRVVGDSLINDIPLKYRVDLKELIVDVIDKKYTLTDDEKDIIRKQVDFLLEDNRIKRISRIRYYSRIIAKATYDFFFTTPK